ncbi:324_t:CDS:2, partial [Ambispora leptoticha]
NATNNTNISNRYAHSAACSSIILYGGSISNHSGVPLDYLITLDLQTFEFSELATKNRPSIDDVSTCQNFKTKNPNRNVIKVLDLSQKDYTWVDEFVTSSTSGVNSSLSSQEKPKTNTGLLTQSNLDLSVNRNSNF